MALALQHKFTINGIVLEWVEVLKYLGCLLAQDNDDAQAIRQQMRKAQGVGPSRAGAARGEFGASGGRKILQGGRPSHPLIRERDVEPFSICPGDA